MKHLKTYEKLVDKEKLRQEIKVAVDEIANNDDMDENLEDCPFLTELNILHEKEYIKEIFFDVTSWDEKITLGEFRNVYNELVIEAETEILKQLKETPYLYQQYSFVSNYVDVPEWLTDSNKYNL